MWQISDMKNRAHFYMGTAYWRSVFAALILSIVTGEIAVNIAEIGVTLIVSLVRMDFVDMYYQFDLGMMGIAPDEFARAAEMAFGTGLLIGVGLILVSLCIKFFVMIPIEVGCRRFYVVNHAMPGRARSAEMFYVFSHRYLHVVGAMFRRSLYQLFWCVLLVFPGIIKHYSYRLVPYILAEEPGMPAGEAITLSRKMMRGSKWHAFLLDLSFLGWHILNLLTLGILGLFYVKPYQATANAELYVTLRDRYLNRY